MGEASKDSDAALDLGLSLGGCYSDSQSSIQAASSSIPPLTIRTTSSSHNINRDLKPGSNSQIPASSNPLTIRTTSSLPNPNTNQNETHVVTHDFFAPQPKKAASMPTTKADMVVRNVREFQAKMRLEAKKRLMEKQRRTGGFDPAAEAEGEGGSEFAGSWAINSASSMNTGFCRAMDKRDNNVVVGLSNNLRFQGSWAINSASMNTGFCRPMDKLNNNVVVCPSSNLRIQGTEVPIPAKEKGKSVQTDKRSPPIPLGTTLSSSSVDTTARGKRVTTSDDSRPDQAVQCNKKIKNGRVLPDGAAMLKDMYKRMPSVTATGTGPNGRKIEGVLYTYLKGKVRIVCVCHGSFHSPAEFVKHAGGTNTGNPMKHIRVLPSAF